MNQRDRWEAVLEDVDESLFPLIERSTERGILVGDGDVEITGEDGSVRRESGFALAYPQTPLRYLILGATDSTGTGMSREMLTAFPFCAEGIETELEIAEVFVDEDPMEGGLRLVTREGGLIWATDPLFFVNRGEYRVGAVLRFSLSALAYTLKPADQNEVVITKGGLVEIERQRRLAADPGLDVSTIQSVNLSMRGSCALFPSRANPWFGSVFRGTVEKVEKFAVERFTAEEVRFTRVLISPMIDGDEAIGMWLYVALHVSDGYEPVVGDEIEGTAWIQALIAPDA